jgi:ankyrin repeat protein
LAAKGGNLEIVQYFIEELDIDVDEYKDEARKVITPLNIAICRGYFEIASYLIEKGAVITPSEFFHSCRMPNLEFTNLILEKLGETMS